MTDNKFSAIIVVCILVFLMATGCGSQARPAPAEPDDEILYATYPADIDRIIQDGFILERPDLLPLIAQSRSINEHAVGWLRIPNTEVDDVVLYYDDSYSPEPNSFYLRRGFDGGFSFEGVYFADFRSSFDGTAEGLARNTVIYGHALDINNNYNAKRFSQLKRFDPTLSDNGEQFARENPYIFFSVEKENLVWEIFAVFDATIRLPYNIPTLQDMDFMHVIREAKERSFYIYDDIEVGVDDKIITLSTCTYKYDQNYPNDYRYVIMAKLADQDGPFREMANLELNPSPRHPRELEAWW